jgi:hypothetical protein
MSDVETTVDLSELLNHDVVVSDDYAGLLKAFLSTQSGSEVNTTAILYGLNAVSNLFRQESDKTLQIVAPDRLDVLLRHTKDYPRLDADITLVPYRLMTMTQHWILIVIRKNPLSGQLQSTICDWNDPGQPLNDAELLRTERETISILLHQYCGTVPAWIGLTASSDYDSGVGVILEAMTQLGLTRRTDFGPDMHSTPSPEAIQALRQVLAKILNKVVTKMQRQLQHYTPATTTTAITSPASLPLTTPPAATTNLTHAPFAKYVAGATGVTALVALAGGLYLRHKRGNRIPLTPFIEPTTLPLPPPPPIGAPSGQSIVLRPALAVTPASTASVSTTMPSSKHLLVLGTALAATASAFVLARRWYQARRRRLRQPEKHQALGRRHPTLPVPSLTRRK